MLHSEDGNQQSVPAQPCQPDRKTNAVAESAAQLHEAYRELGEHSLLLIVVALIGILIVHGGGDGLGVAKASPRFIVAKRLLPALDLPVVLASGADSLSSTCKNGALDKRGDCSLGS
ncbi:MAG: hypothetical protein FRX49_08592 [Trebouxia sp. A1-2]|nr:MAG: hypothetical protein FRX49_08592 [Trebouxia sp. A1-2]